MTIPYRIRRLLRHIAVTAVVLVLFCAALLASWLLWLNRYVVYTEDGAKFDFSLSQVQLSGVPATPPAPGETVSIVYPEFDEQTQEKPKELGQIVGYTVSIEQLEKKPDEVMSALLALPEGSAVALELKTIRGNALYSTTLSRMHDQIDIASIDRLIRALQENDLYLIAKIPAFRDHWYFEDNMRTNKPQGLPHVSGDGSLWVDRDGPHYWINPASADGLNHLVQVITELRTLGFDEVMLYDFRFPNTDNISFTGNKEEALQNAAITLAQSCATDRFALSFVSSKITLPAGRCRLYAEGVSASDIPTFVASQALSNPLAQVVFLTDLLDTRFDSHSVLRPLDIPTE